MQLRNGSTPKLPRAFIFRDFEFSDADSRPLHPSQRHRAEFLTITWRKHKNADNGKQITFHRAKNPRLCPVRAGANIYTRALTLHHSDGLLVVSDAGPITDKQIAQTLQSVARTVYGYSKIRVNSDIHPILFASVLVFCYTRQVRQQLLLRSDWDGNQTRLWNTYAIRRDGHVNMLRPYLAGNSIGTNLVGIPSSRTNAIGVINTINAVGFVHTTVQYPSNNK